ncbi:MAG: HAD family hydrolase [Alphaproteobacteria bacterium]|nr:HAD family hydrolase [Alphaproteobacteria bacterium]
MSEGQACAVIFDVDGVILHLTPPEEAAFFQALESVFGIDDASPDWDSYRARNDVEIVEELIETRLGRPAVPDDLIAFTDKYIYLVDVAIRTGEIEVLEVAGIRNVLMALTQVDNLIMGLATANLMGMAKMRLRHVGLNDFFKIGGFAEARGPKRQILQTTIAGLQDEKGRPLPKERIVFLGDNVGDVDAGLANGCGLIAFSEEESKHQKLKDAGATLVIGNHSETVPMIEHLLGQVLRS